MKTTVTVPEGHHVEVHAPGMPMAPQTGMIADPAQAGALQAMNAALPIANESAQGASHREQPARKTKSQAVGDAAKKGIPAGKKPEKKPAAKPAKKD